MLRFVAIAAALSVGSTAAIAAVERPPVKKTSKCPHAQAEANRSKASLAPRLKQRPTVDQAMIPRAPRML